MNEIATPQQIENAVVFRRLVSLYLENRDLILMGGIVQAKILICDPLFSSGRTDGPFSNPLMRNHLLMSPLPGFKSVWRICNEF